LDLWTAANGPAIRSPAATFSVGVDDYLDRSMIPPGLLTKKRGIAEQSFCQEPQIPPKFAQLKSPGTIARFKGPWALLVEPVRLTPAKSLVKGPVNFQAISRFYHWPFLPNFHKCPSFQPEI
jgi:hypothetical protein